MLSFMFAQSLKTFHRKRKKTKTTGELVLKCERQEFACISEPERICTDKSDSEPRFSKDEKNLDPVFRFDSLRIKNKQTNKNSTTQSNLKREAHCQEGLTCIQSTKAKAMLESHTVHRWIHISLELRELSDSWVWSRYFSLFSHWFLGWYFLSPWAGEERPRTEKHLRLSACLHMEATASLARNCRSGRQVKSPGVCLRPETFVFAKRTGDL